MERRIGVFICECGPNIKDSINLDEIERSIQYLDDIVLTRTFNLFCSEEGKKIIKDEIQKNLVTHIVIAGCSPKEHEITFRKVLNESGINPFLLQIANIREQCAWVVRDKGLATKKAKAIISSAIKRLRFHEPLETKEIECNPDVLIVGAGVAGMSAALNIVQKDRKVYLVEKLPYIGGKSVRYEKVFPDLECTSCMLDPLLDKVLHNEHIEILTLSEVCEVLGYYGNFLIKIKKKARFVDKETCIGCGACFEVCPVKVRNEHNEGLDFRKAVYIPCAGALPHIAIIDEEHCLHLQGQDCNLCQNACPFGSINFEEKEQVKELNVGAIVLATGFSTFNPEKAPQYGYGRVEDVYTGLEFERLLNSDGPTEGRILLKNKKTPKRVAIIHCVGSRTKRFHEYCSGICCMNSLKFAYLIKEQLPKTTVTEFYSDLCLPGKKSQDFFNKVAVKNGVNLIHLKSLDSIKVTEKKGGISIQYKDNRGKKKESPFDLVVLSTAIEPNSDAKEVAKIFGISQGKEGFFEEEQIHLSPVSTNTSGIFIAGCARGPKDIQGAVTDGQAVAGNILSLLKPGERLILEPINAEVDEDICSGCKTCVSLCPYKAITHTYTPPFSSPLTKGGQRGVEPLTKGGQGDRRAVAMINELLCRGCGICVASCPSGAIYARHFTDEQIIEEMKGLLADE
ncbi:MAG: 4Fe-4S binding protein [Thermodesulfovibrionales bacterium]